MSSNRRTDEEDNLRGRLHTKKFEETSKHQRVRKSLRRGEGASAGGWTACAREKLILHAAGLEAAAAAAEETRNKKKSLVGGGLGPPPPATTRGGCRRFFTYRLSFSFFFFHSVSAATSWGYLQFILVLMVLHMEPD